MEKTKTADNNEKLRDQLSFPLYACSRQVIRQYKPHLDELGLTYTQYITMQVMWDRKTVNVKQLGDALYLDSGTLTPLLKRLEANGLVTRTRSRDDERSLVVAITKKGEALKEKAADIPEQIQKCLRLSPEEASELYSILNKVMIQLA